MGEHRYVLDHKTATLAYINNINVRVTCFWILLCYGYMYSSNKRSHHHTAV